MNSKLWIQKALTMCLLAAITATYSMVALANADKASGELMIIGGNSNDTTSSVTVNGEPAKNGRTVFSSSTITTPEGMRAILNLNKAGKIEIAPNTTFTLNFDGTAIGGNLSAGSITVLNAAKSVGVKTLSGEVIQLKAGETAMATAGNAAKQTNSGAGGADWFWYALIFGGALAAIIYAASSDNDTRLGGGTSTVSPTR